MSNATRTKPPVKRTIRLHRAPTDNRSGKVTITQDGEATTYLIDRQETQIGGVAWQLRKIEVETADDGTQTFQAKKYNTLLNGSESSCDCNWGIYGSHKKHCRHVAGLMQLHAEGKLS